MIKNLKTFKIANFSNDPAGWTDGNPFHGDYYIIKTIHDYMQQADMFIETGTAYAESSYFVADNFPNKLIYTCETDDNRFNISNKTLKFFSNVKLLKMPSPDFLYHLDKIITEFKNKKCVFWLDAHGEWYENGQKKYSWPLKEEVNFITSNFKNYAIFIDDFKNPYVNGTYDICAGNVCGPEAIKTVLNKAKIYHPTYTEVTSKYHDKIVGVGLITDIEPIKNEANFILTNE